MTTKDKTKKAARLSLAERLLKIERDGTPRATIAMNLGVSPKAVLNLMRGAMPRLDTAYRASLLLGVSLDEIAAEFAHDAAA